MIVTVKDNHKGNRPGTVGWLQSEITGVVIEHAREDVEVGVLEMRNGERVPIVVDDPVRDFSRGGNGVKYVAVSRHGALGLCGLASLGLTDAAWGVIGEIGKQVAEYMNNPVKADDLTKCCVRLQFIED